ncbi:MAG: ribosome-associated translation inhibitor RaiA [Patescibacteria group bacterium]
MQIRIQATNLELTAAIEEYVRRRLLPLERFLGGDNQIARADVEIGLITRHHKQGNVFRAEVSIHTPRQNFRASSEADDLYAAIDDVKEEVEREIVSGKDKSRTLFRRGAFIVKDILKGFGKFKWKHFPRLPKMPRRKR